MNSFRMLKLFFWEILEGFQSTLSSRTPENERSGKLFLQQKRMWDSDQKPLLKEEIREITLV